MDCQSTNISVSYFKPKYFNSTQASIQTIESFKQNAIRASTKKNEKSSAK